MKKCKLPFCIFFSKKNFLSPCILGLFIDEHYLFNKKTYKLGIYTVAILIPIGVDLYNQKLLTHIFSDK